MTATIGELVAAYNVEVDQHLDRQAEIPILTGRQRQGDVLIVPTPDATEATTPVPLSGTPVVRGENGGHTHEVVTLGVAFCDVRTATTRDLRLATLTVPDGALAYLAHPEHGYNGIGPGTYELRRQRQMADQMRLVQD